MLRSFENSGTSTQVRHGIKRGRNMTATGKLALYAKKSDKLLNLTAYRGTVAAVSNEMSKTVGGSSIGRSPVDVIATVVLDSGLQKSVAITNSLHVIPGNEIAFILDGSEQLIFLKNYASNETETASLDDDTDRTQLWMFLFLGMGGFVMMAYGKKAPIPFLGIACIVIAIFAVPKILKSTIKRDAQIDEIFQSKLTSMGISLDSCKSSLTKK
jgi:hypothetical protein